MEIEEILKFEGLKQPRSNRDRWCVPCTRENPPNELRTDYSWVVGSTPSQDPAQPTRSPGTTAGGEEPFPQSPHLSVPLNPLQTLQENLSNGTPRLRGWGR